MEVVYNVNNQSKRNYERLNQQIRKRKTQFN
jgi:hypothetical protein